MFDRTQWVSVNMLIAVLLQLSQPITAAVPIGKTVQIAQTNNSDTNNKENGQFGRLYEKGTPEALESLRAGIARYEKMLKEVREAGNRSFEAIILNNIGEIYSLLGEPQKALEYYSQSVPLRRAVGHRDEEAITLNNIGNIY